MFLKPELYEFYDWITETLLVMKNRAILTILGLNGGWTSLFSMRSQSILLKNAWPRTSSSPLGPQPSLFTGFLVKNCKKRVVIPLNKLHTLTCSKRKIFKSFTNLFVKLVLICSLLISKQGKDILFYGRFRRKLFFKFPVIICYVCKYILH